MPYAMWDSIVSPRYAACDYGRRYRLVAEPKPNKQKDQGRPESFCLAGVRGHYRTFCADIECYTKAD